MRGEARPAHSALARTGPGQRAVSRLRPSRPIARVRSWSPAFRCDVLLRAASRLFSGLDGGQSLLDERSCSITNGQTGKRARERLSRYAELKERPSLTDSVEQAAQPNLRCGRRLRLRAGARVKTRPIAHRPLFLPGATRFLRFGVTGGVYSNELRCGEPAANLRASPSARFARKSTTPRACS